MRYHLHYMGGVLEELGLDPRFRLLYKQSYNHVHFKHLTYATREGPRFSKYPARPMHAQEAVAAEVPPHLHPTSIY